MVTKSPEPESEVVHAAAMHSVPGLVVLVVLGTRRQLPVVRAPSTTPVTCTIVESKVIPKLNPFTPVVSSFVCMFTVVELPTAEIEEGFGLKATVSAVAAVDSAVTDKNPIAATTESRFIICPLR
jgi:hypothetical protein